MRSRTEPPRRGFTLIEALVTLVILTVIIVGLLTLLDSSSRLSKQETQVADAQGSGRSAVYEVTRLVRQARVGHLSPLNSVMPYANNAAEADLGNQKIRAGTDAIQIRGVFFGDTYYFEADPEAPDVICNPSPCTGTSTATVRIRQKISSLYENYPSGGHPELGNRTEPFFFVVSDTTAQSIAKGADIYSIPLYYVGKVNATKKMDDWLKPTAGGFQFTVEFNDAGAQAMNATKLLGQGLQRPFAGGVVDDLVLFVAKGPQDPDGAFTHPFLAQAVLRPDGTWDVQRLVDEVEDLQIAYGVDTMTTPRDATGILDKTRPDRGVDPAYVKPGGDDDEWVYNSEKDTALEKSDDPLRYEAFLTGSSSAPTDPSLPSPATPALKAVYVGIVTKSLDPDFKFNGPGAGGIRIFDSGPNPVSARPYRRRSQTMAVNLRNFS